MVERVCRAELLRQILLPLERVVLYKKNLEYLEVIGDIPMQSRIYVDESFLYSNEAQTHGRSPRGQRLYRPRDRHGQRWTVYMAIRISGLVHAPILSKENATDGNFMRYVTNNLIPKIHRGDVVIWDRLGRSGRCKNPSKQHYNPEARVQIEKKGGRLIFLPPKGHLFNPIELTFAAMKNKLRSSYAWSTAGKEQRPWTEHEIKLALTEIASNFRSQQVRVDSIIIED